MPRVVPSVLATLLLLHGVAGLRILALHGKGGSGAQLERVLKPLADYLSSDGGAECELICPDAPHEGRSWWLIEPFGARSFEAASFEGVPESIALLQQAAAGEPFDAVIGHSQGGMLGSVLVAQRALRYGRSRKILRASAPGVFSGAALPKPYEDLFARVFDERPSLPPTLHCIGSADEIIPPEQSERLAQVFAPNAVRLAHDGGHVTPLDEASLQKISSVLRLVDADGAMRRRVLDPNPAASDDVLASPKSKTGKVHGVPLKAILSQLVDRHGWDELARAVPIRCFMNEPSITSSLRFLRKTDWAREKVERIYVEGLDTRGPRTGGRSSSRANHGFGTSRPGTGGRGLAAQQAAPFSATSGAAKRRALREHQERSARYGRLGGNR